MIYLGAFLIAAAVASITYILFAPKGVGVIDTPVLAGAPAGSSSIPPEPTAEPAPNLHSAMLSRSRAERVVQPGIERVNSVLTSFLPDGKIRDLHRSAITAGLQRTWTRKRIARMKTVGTIFGAVIALIAFVKMTGTMRVLVAAIIFGIGYKAVDVFLEGRAKARQDEIIRDLPDFTDQIAISVQAGLGFEAAIQRTAKSNVGALADELTRLIQDVRLGSTREAAFKALAARIDVQDLTTFIRAVSQAERTGVSIADILQIQSDELRERRRQRAEERAMKLPVLMLIPMVTCILPPLLIVLLGPAIVQVTQTGFSG